MVINGHLKSVNRKYFNMVDMVINACIKSGLVQ